jgi:hypothetical protein
MPNLVATAIALDEHVQQLRLHQHDGVRTWALGRLVYFVAA